MKHRLPTISILGIPIVRATEAEALAEIRYLAENAAPSMVVFVNAHTLTLSSSDTAFHQILLDAAIVLNDGIGVTLAAKMLRGPTFPANLNGTDLTPLILKMAAENGWRVFLLGAAPGVAEKAAAKFVAQTPGLAIAGTHSGYFKAEDVGRVINLICEAKTDVLIVGMGNPVQEKWLAQHLEKTGVKLGVGVGAFLDFSAGVFPRAPLWMQKAKIEWLFRMSREPKRLWKRYLLGGPVFLARVAWYKLTRKR